MYYPIGWPKLLDSQKAPLRLATDKVKILFAVLHEKSVALWFCKPCVPITYHQRSEKCIAENGTNAFIEWKIDSSKLVVAVSTYLSHCDVDDLDDFRCKDNSFQYSYFPTDQRWGINNL